MSRQHEVNIVINKGNGIREPVLCSRKARLREWFVKKLFGEAREILVLNPGESIKTVEITEIRED